MFKLYHNKQTGELRIEPIGKIMIDTSKITNAPTKFNDVYMVCSDRKVLKEKAEQFKNEWIKETEELLEKYKSIKIQVKY